MADELDPRYAPQFQRGFDAAQHVASPTRSGPVRLPGGPPSTAQRVPDPPPLTRDPEVTEPADTADAVAPEQTSAPPPLTWWDWLLPVIGGGLILVALLLWGRLATETSSYFGSGPTDQWNAFLQQASYTLPVPLLTAGIVGVTGGTVLQAVRASAMTVRIGVLAAIAVLFLIAGLSALWEAAGMVVGFQDPFAPLIDDQQEQASLQAWLNALMTAGGPLIGAGLIAGVGALALVVRRRSEPHG